MKLISYNYTFKLFFSRQCLFIIAINDVGLIYNMKITFTLCVWAESFRQQICFWTEVNGWPWLQGTGHTMVSIKHPITEFHTSHSSLGKTEQALYHSVQSWHHMECGCRLEIESSGAHLSCWAQMHCSPHTVWLIATVRITQTHSHQYTYVHVRRQTLSHSLPPPSTLYLLSLSPRCGPAMSADPRQGWQLFAGWCYREEARGHGKGGDTCPLCVLQHQSHT